MWALIATAAAAGISAWNAHSKAERDNKAVEAQQTLLERQRHFKRQMYRVQTFSEYYDALDAGAARLNQALSSGFQVKGLSRFGQGEMAEFRRSKYVKYYALKQEEGDAQFKIASLNERKESPSGAAFKSFLGEAASTGAAFGAGGYFDPKDVPKPKGTV